MAYSRSRPVSVLLMNTSTKAITAATSSADMRRHQLLLANPCSQSTTTTGKSTGAIILVFTAQTRILSRVANPHIFLTIAPAYATVIVGKIRKDSNVKSTISAACLLYQTHDSSTRITTALHTPQQISSNLDKI